MSLSKAEKNLGPIARGNWVNFDLGQVKIYVGLVTNGQVYLAFVALMWVSLVNDIHTEGSNWRLQDEWQYD